MEILSYLLQHRKVFVSWLFAAALLALLGFVRHSTDAEFAFASAAIIPVYLVTWVGGFGHGLVASLLAVLMWIVTDPSDAKQNEIWLPYLNGITRLGTYTFVAYMTAKVRMLLMREMERATHDTLTGLLNRRAFLDAGETETARTLRYSHSMAVIFLDLDNFKQLNDSRGHDAGDAALQAVAKALGNTLRATDTVARLGGDEFAVILPEVDRKSAEEAGNKIADAIADALLRFPPVSASLGIAWFEKGRDDFATMLKAADVLMYKMKRDGKGGVRLQAFE